jgi:hypothetical protein
MRPAAKSYRSLMGDNFSPLIAAYRKARAIYALGVPGEGMRMHGDDMSDDPLTSAPAEGEEQGWLDQMVDKLSRYMDTAEGWTQTRAAARAKEFAVAIAEAAKLAIPFLRKYAVDRVHDAAEIVRRARAFGIEWGVRTIILAALGLWGLAKVFK